MKAHRTDGVSLFFGLLFVTLSVWWLLAQLLDLALPAIGWFLAGGLIMVGLFGLLGAVRASRHASGPGNPGSENSGSDPSENSGSDPVEPVTAPPAPDDRRD